MTLKNDTIITKGRLITATPLNNDDTFFARIT